MTGSPGQKIDLQDIPEGQPLPALRTQLEDRGIALGYSEKCADHA